MCDTKACIDCLEEFPATTEHFQIHSRKNPQWLRPYCRSCASKRHARWAAGNRAKTRANSLRCYQKTRSVRIAKQCEYQRKVAADPIRSDRRKTQESLWRAERLKIPGNIERQRASWRNATKTEAGRKRLKRLNRLRRARQFGSEGHFTQAEFQAVLSGQNFLCFYCDDDIRGGKDTADHYIPLSKGGSDLITNIVAACKSCNCRKNNRSAEQFIAELRYEPPQRAIN